MHVQKTNRHKILLYSVRFESKKKKCKNLNNYKSVYFHTAKVRKKYWYIK